jgi:hypothetical protein
VTGDGFRNRRTHETPWHPRNYLTTSRIGRPADTTSPASCTSAFRSIGPDQDTATRGNASSELSSPPWSRCRHGLSGHSKAQVKHAEQVGPPVSRPAFVPQTTPPRHDAGSEVEPSSASFELQAVSLTTGIATRMAKALSRPASPACERDKGFYVITKGSATVTAGGVERARLSSGAHFGEVAVIDGGPRTATVTAATRPPSSSPRRRCGGCSTRSRPSQTRWRSGSHCWSRTPARPRLARSTGGASRSSPGASARPSIPNGRSPRSLTEAPGVDSSVRAAEVTSRYRACSARPGRSTAPPPRSRRVSRSGSPPGALRARRSRR